MPKLRENTVFFKVYKALATSETPLTSEEISKQTGVTPGSVRRELSGLMQLGKITRKPYSYQLKRDEES